MSHLLTVLACVLAGDNELTEEEKSAGWVLLFDGKSTDGWMNNKNGGDVPASNVEEASLNPFKSGAYVVMTKEKYGDFVLSCDFKVSKGCNSGIFIRTGNPKNPVQTGIEIQVLDSAGKSKPGKHDCGAIYDVVPPSANPVKPAGEWNTMVITAKGPSLKVVLNGETVAEMDMDRWTEAGKNPDGSKNKFKTAYKDMPREGHLGFQDHGKPVWFKNIKLKKLD